ncbi:MAG: histidinol-phosphate transaminase [Ruminococcaceae bacterium]|nr:histidinol-phosphate transaminase [Oscillospiraceae bacterium]
MSRFLSARLSALTPYTPGEQPRERKYIKLNTNESPFPPSPKAIAAAAEAAESLQLYSDPTCHALVEQMAARYGVSPDEVLMTNGSDEVLNFAFMAFCDDEHPALFPDITYGFYKVFAALNRVPYRELPLREDFTVDLADYKKAAGTVFLANPNAPTGLALSTAEIEALLQANPDRIVVVDEAYVDFGGESCIPLIHKYENLLVTGTFSKSRSMAGARLGFGIANAALIRDLDTVKYSTNPYNVNRMTAAAGLGVLADEDYTQANCKAIIENRESAKTVLKTLGFEMTDSLGNFLFIRHPKRSGEEIYLALRERGILVRHFNQERIKEYNRVTVGTKAEMDALLLALTEIVR